MSQESNVNDNTVTTCDNLVKQFHDRALRGEIMRLKQTDLRFDSMRFDPAKIQRQGNSGFDSVAIRFGWDSMQLRQLRIRIRIVI